METVTSLAVQKFFQRLGEQISTPAVVKPMLKAWMELN